MKKWCYISENSCIGGSKRLRKFLRLLKLNLIKLQPFQLYFCCFLSPYHSPLSQLNSDRCCAAWNQLPQCHFYQMGSRSFHQRYFFLFPIYGVSQQSFMNSIFIIVICKLGNCFSWKYQKILFRCLLKRQDASVQTAVRKRLLVHPSIYSELFTTSSNTLL